MNHTHQKYQKVKIYCDGACSGNPGVGGWGALIMCDKEIREIFGGEKYTTNNRMELIAAINALKMVSSEIQTDEAIEVYTDSTYLKNGITDWIHNWRRTNWKNGKIKNQDLWKMLDEIGHSIHISWHWVKGHSGHEFNERADALANLGIKNIKLS